MPAIDYSIIFYQTRTINTKNGLFLCIGLFTHVIARVEIYWQC